MRLLVIDYEWIEPKMVSLEIKYPKSIIARIRTTIASQLDGKWFSVKIAVNLLCFSNTAHWDRREKGSIIHSLCIYRQWLSFQLHVQSHLSPESAKLWRHPLFMLCIHYRLCRAFTEPESGNYYMPLHFKFAQKIVIVVFVCVCVSPSQDKAALFRFSLSHYIHHPINSVYAWLDSSITSAATLCLVICLIILQSLIYGLTLGVMERNPFMPPVESCEITRDVCV